MVSWPKNTMFFCQGDKCKSHKKHKVSQYKAAKKSGLGLGDRRYDRKQSGFGGQTKPIFHKKAKTTKKILLKLQCTTCKRVSQKTLKRCKQFSLGQKKK
mmetsp:Transcript_11494/g.43140  ORF Transcript_11494/g.43140 Transcript_11494/m.43140 type:complete len:99 (-) Transcript_11494:97-393(-)